MKSDEEQCQQLKLHRVSMNNSADINVGFPAAFLASVRKYRG
jgi:hypothetical protein